MHQRLGDCAFAAARRANQHDIERLLRRSSHDELSPSQIASRRLATLCRPYYTAKARGESKHPYGLPSMGGRPTKCKVRKNFVFGMFLKRPILFYSLTGAAQPPHTPISKCKAHLK